MSMLIQALGVLAVICWCCLFIPQLYENYKRSSTQGLSLSMCLLWCLSGVACVAYLIYEQEGIALVVQFSLMSFGSLLTIGQIFFYDTFRKDGAADYRRTCSWTFFLLIFFVGIGAALIALFDYTQNEVCVAVLGSILPSIGFAVGFFPQIYEIVKTKNGRGYSAGLSILDSTGSILSIIVLVLDKGNLIGVIPFGVIFILQYFMLFLKLKYPGSAGDLTLQSDTKKEIEVHVVSDCKV
jgi:uncharacterized protein with PQ loop repeat